MRSVVYQLGAVFAACGLALSAPVATADPTVTLPPLTSGGGGPIIGGGNNSGISQQLTGLGNSNVQEVDGSDAAQFITAAAALTKLLPDEWGMALMARRSRRSADV